MSKLNMGIKMLSSPSVHNRQPNRLLFSYVVSLSLSLLCQAHMLQKQQTLLTEVSQSPCGFSSYLTFDPNGPKASKVCVCVSACMCVCVHC